MIILTGGAALTIFRFTHFQFAIMNRMLRLEH